MLLVITLFTFLIHLTSNCVNGDANLRMAFVLFGNLTNQFLFTVQPNDGLNLSFGLISQLLAQNPPSSDPVYYINYFWKTYVGYYILLIIGVAFIFIFTMVGICYCTCRCCCKRCGVKPPGPSSTNTKRKRILFNLILFLFATMILIGCIISMGSNGILQDATKATNDTSDKHGNLIYNIDTIVQYATDYINFVANNAQTTGYSTLRNTLSSITSALTGITTLFINTYLNQLNYILVLNATSAVMTMYTGITTSAQRLVANSTLHQAAATDFGKYLDSMNQNLTTLLKGNQCQNFVDNCKTVSDLLPQTVIGFNMSNINYTADQNVVNVLNTYNISDMQQSLNIVLAKAANVTNVINSTVMGYIQNFTNTLSGNNIVLTSYNSSVAYKNTLINYINTYKSQLYNLTPDGKTTIQNGFLYSYYQYVFYGFTTLNCIILVVVLLFYVGLCYGMCGGPNFEDSPSCSKGIGSGFLMGSVAISFIFGWLIMLVVTIMFLVGGLLETEGCSYLTNKKPVMTVDQIVTTLLTSLNYSFNLNGAVLSLPNVNYLTSLLTRCSNATDLITAFQIPSSYITAVSDIFYKQFVSTSLMALIQSIRSYSIPSIDVSNLLNSSAQMLPVITILSSHNSTSTVEELKKAALVLADVRGFVNTVADLSLIANKTDPAFATALNASISQLIAKNQIMNDLQKSYLSQKIELFTLLAAIISPIFYMNNVINSLPSRSSDAQTTAVGLANSTLIQNATSIMNNTVFSMIRSLGNCAGLATTYNAAISMFCTTFLVPFNNIWMGFGWFLIFIIPAMAFAIKLHRLYRISHIENRTSNTGRAYQSTNHFLSKEDMDKIRSRRYESHA